MINAPSLRPARPAPAGAVPSARTPVRAPVPRRAGAGPALPARQRVATTLRVPPASSSAAAEPSPPAPRLGLVQHKAEARLFYRFLSIVYDKIVNPG